MTEKEAERLVVGSRVRWSGEDDPQGTVIETGYKYLKIRWDDGSPDSHLHPADCFRIIRSR